MKTIFILCIIFHIHFNKSKLYAQQIDSLLGSTSIFIPANKELIVYLDSVDNSDFCQTKTKELFYLRTKLFAKLDSVNEMLEKLRENNPGRIYYLEISGKVPFNFEGCFKRRKIIRRSHGLDADVVDLEIRIKEEGRFHNSMDGSSGWTIYRDEIRKIPK